MKLGLEEFVDASKKMVHHCGVKKTRLLLRLRPHQHQRTFVVKCTNGTTTLISRVTHQGQLRLVEGLIGDYVSRCTCASLPPVLNAQPVQSTSSEAVVDAPAEKQSNKGQAPGTAPQQQRSGNAKGGKGKKRK